MNCPIDNAETRILRTDSGVRRRECVRCGHRFSTSEILTDELERSKRIIEDAKALADRIREAA